MNKDWVLKEKLEKLRKEWKAASEKGDLILCAVIERRAKLLQNSLELTIDKV